MKKSLTSIKHFIFPYYCKGCGCLTINHIICHQCYRLLPWYKNKKHQSINNQPAVNVASFHQIIDKIKQANPDHFKSAEDSKIKEKKWKHYIRRVRYYFQPIMREYFSEWSQDEVRYHQDKKPTHPSVIPIAKKRRYQKPQAAYQDQEVCEQCGERIQYSQSKICAKCISKAPHFDKTMVVFHYHPPISEWIKDYKYKQQLCHTEFFAKCLHDRIKDLKETEEWPDTVVSVPLHRKKLRERGFNQTHEIAKQLKQLIDINYQPFLVSRMKHTLAQANCPSAKLRIKNIKGAFTCHLNLKGQHIAIIDDVMRTGATVNELAKVLKQRGAKKVSIWVISR